VLAALAIVPAAVAETRPASIGNYYFEDERTGDRTKIVVRQGDQVAFTVREDSIFARHTVDVDELEIHSGDLLLGQTYTTPQLNRVGNFLLYCDPHRERGQVARLIIQAAPTAATPAPAVTAAPAPAAAPGPQVATAVPSATPTATPTLAPVGVTTASPEDLARPVAVDPDSLEGLTGRARSTQPWTRAVWFLVIGAVPIVVLAGLALRREFARAAAAGPARGSSRSSGDRRRSSSRSPRSSARKASGSGRTSRGRRR